VKDSQKAQLMEQALETGKGIVRIIPTWMPRRFSFPGRRLRLAGKDLYAFGLERGGTCERWLSSIVFGKTGSASLSAPIQFYLL